MSTALVLGDRVGASSLAVGLHDNVSPALYHARELGVISKTVLDLVNRAPAFYEDWLRGPEREPGPALVFGAAFHCALLEPERYAKDYAIAPPFGDCRFKANRERRDGWRKDNAGKLPLSEEDGAIIAAMVDRVHAHPLNPFRRGRSEVTLRWDDEATGLPCKGRLDWYDEERGIAVDVKTTEDARSWAFAKSCADFRYHVQEAMYRTGLAAVGRPCSHFCFVAIEKQPPHLVALYEFDESALIRGLRAVEDDSRVLAECVATGVYPGYSEHIRKISLPPWAKD